MSRRYRTSRIGTGRLAQWWPVLLSLLVVLVPTVCVLWFMTEAVENRRLVIRRALADADFTVAQERLERYWEEQAAALEKGTEDGASGSIVFEKCVLEKRADSVACYDPAGRLVYPAPATVPTASEAEESVDWSDVERLEYEERELDEAAAAYATVAATHGDPASDTFDANLSAQALQAQARCLAKADQVDVAIKILADALGQKQYRHAVDSRGRLIVAAAELRALELIDDPSDSRFRVIVERLSERLNRYDDPALAAPQRVFLMRRLQTLVQEWLSHAENPASDSPGRRHLAEPLRTALVRAVEFPTLEAEKLAAEFCEVNPIPSKDAVVRLTQSPGVWQLASPNKRVFALFRTKSVLSRSQAAISSRTLKSGAEVTPVPPGKRAAPDAVVHSAEAGRYLPGWRLTHSARGGKDSEPTSDAQIAAYFWTGILVIAAMSIFAAIIARSFRRQMKLTRLRNDLVATVSHELKTPLSSIRLLVDTLLDEPELNEQKVREYLELMAKENKRLSRLIDNFLAFSRMERNKHAFEFAEISAADVIDAAAEAVRERFHSPECRFDVEVADDLPPIDADADAMVTALVNLLDNAYKYSAAEKHIVLRAYVEGGNVCFDVEDHGIGLSRTASKKVFKRFYQVDRRMSRDTGGVGLGLSIVQFIVTAHHGTVRVRSRPGQGSTFTITLPSVSVESQTSREHPPE